MATTTVSPCHDARQIGALLDLPEIRQLGWRPDHGARISTGQIVFAKGY